MENVENASELRGILIVSREEGAILGAIDSIYIDPDTRALVAVGYRPRKNARRDRFVLTQAIEKVGRDVVLIDSEDSAKAVDEETTVPGRSLKSLQGCWVTTDDGRHLGTLVDVDFSSAHWLISELELADNKRLPVDPNELRIGDEIIVPRAYAERVTARPEAQYGVMGRLLGGDRIDDIRSTIQRVLGSNKKDS
ncbi:MAG: PRC-barrel domain-containing protein [Deltaproteobacteria bacterium]|nr:PRC-barrel domain-containing protein [Deltaproteobacteria bacterium]